MNQKAKLNQSKTMNIEHVRNEWKENNDDNGIKMLKPECSIINLFLRHYKLEYVLEVVDG